MKPEKVNIYSSDQKDSRITVVPSHADGVFVTGFNLWGERHVGRSINLYGIDRQDALQLEQALESGEVTTILDKYVQAVPERLGVYSLIGCHGTLETTEHSWAGIADDLITEFVPYLSEAK